MNSSDAKHTSLARGEVTRDFPGKVRARTRRQSSRRAGASRGNRGVAHEINGQEVRATLGACDPGPGIHGPAVLVQPWVRRSGITGRRA